MQTTIAGLRLVILGLAAAANVVRTALDLGGDYQTSSVDYVAFPQPLQVRTSICIDRPCTQYSVTFTTPDSRLGVFCTSSPCAPTTSVTVQNPMDFRDRERKPCMSAFWPGVTLVRAATRGTTL